METYLVEETIYMGVISSYITVTKVSRCEVLCVMAVYLSNYWLILRHLEYSHINVVHFRPQFPLDSSKKRCSH